MLDTVSRPVAGRPIVPAGEMALEAAPDLHPCLALSFLALQATPYQSAIVAARCRFGGEAALMAARSVCVPDWVPDSLLSRCFCGLYSPCVIRKITGTLALLFLLSASPARASTHTWTGVVNQNWSVAGNWTGGVPTTGESGGTVVSFPAGSTSTMDISGLVVDQINFTGSGSTISGSTPLGINGAHFTTAINDANGGNAITEPVALSGATSVQASVSEGQLTITGVISGSQGLTKTGTGMLSLITSTNTYAGVTDVQQGVLGIKASGTFAIPGALIIGTGAGAAGSATVRDVSFGNDIAATSNVTVNADGVLDISTGSVTEHIAGLTVNGGSVTLGY
jgi:autotransporter-associated beta strand protein